MKKFVKMYITMFLYVIMSINKYGFAVIKSSIDLIMLDLTSWEDAL